MDEIRNVAGIPETGERTPEQTPRLDPRTAQLIRMLEQNAALYRTMGHEATMFPPDKPGVYLSMTRRAPKIVEP